VRTAKGLRVPVVHFDRDVASGQQKQDGAGRGAGCRTRAARSHDETRGQEVQFVEAVAGDRPAESCSSARGPRSVWRSWPSMPFGGIRGVSPWWTRSAAPRGGSSRWPGENRSEGPERQADQGVSLAGEAAARLGRLETVPAHWIVLTDRC